MSLIIRNPVALGAFYPRSSSELRTTIDKFMKTAGEVEKRNVLGMVSPHAGYVYCGKTQAHAYKSLLENTTFVIIGPNHMGLGANASIMCEGIWKTPLGICRIDSELARKILEKSKFLEEDLHAHAQEHSIEVQLPWLQYMFTPVNFVPICLGHTSLEAYKDIGLAIRDSVIGNTVVIASSDFTHFGESYGYTPVSGGPGNVLGFMEKVDLEAAKAVADIAPERFLEIIEKYRATICGRAAIATMLYAVKDRATKGTILDYSTSYELSRNIHALVGYCGIVIE